ncbi:MAG: UDP-N-acetyl glucosamine 2-epimerase, partial [Elioraea sp.]|nr:UDP-N-acetyl glucosamine 2-epimerase [Elioraea sp.]
MKLHETLIGPVLCVVGARPNYMKMAPLLRAFADEPSMPRAVLVHTGQHYDYALNDQLFRDLDLPSPDINLEVGSASHAVQTAEVMKRFEPVVDDLKPSAVLVVGDVNSTLACSLVAAKKGVAVIHVEAGLRSFDRSMPEEINRVLTDQLADLLYTTERSAHANLAREGIAPERIAFVGNLMIDSLHAALPKAVPPEDTLRRAAADPARLHDARGFGVVTLHRPSNVDDPVTLAEVLDILRAVATRLPLVWPVHPRTRASIERAGLTAALGDPRLICL